MPMNLIIREKRKEQGLTQEQVAQYLGVSTPAVSKWESGASYPDMSLLSALARLLRVDPNTLLCFHEEPSEQEIRHFCSKISQILKEKGMDAGLEESVRVMKQRILEYPRCGKLFHTFAMTLDGTLIMSGLAPEEKKPYEDLALSWYQSVLEYGDENTKTNAAYMLASKYMTRKEYEKAQEMIDFLPEHNVLDKKLIQADLCLQQKDHLPEAAELVQKKLLSATMELDGILFRLMRIRLLQEDTKKAEQIARIAGEAISLLGYRDYFSHAMQLEIAVFRKDAAESIRLLKALFCSVDDLWDLKDCPLYDQIAAFFSSGSAYASRILPPMAAILRHSPEYDFLRAEPEFQQLLEQYDKQP